MYEYKKATGESPRGLLLKSDKKDENYVEQTIEYTDSNGDSLAVIVYALFDEVCYISWVHVCKILRNNGIGKTVSKRISKSDEEK